MNELDLNLIVFASSAGMVLIYHLYLRARLRKDPSYTIQAINSGARAAWVRKIMSGNGSRDVLAVQTLRNSTMASTFLASTAILLIIGVLNMIPKVDPGTSVLHSLEEHATGGDLIILKLVPLLVALFWAFFSFSLAIRFYNHVGYLINAASESCSSPTIEFVARVLNRSGRCYSLGMRAYYLSVPLVFWFFGPWYLLASALGLVVVLYYVDRAPSLLVSEQLDIASSETSEEVSEPSARRRKRTKVSHQHLSWTTPNKI